MPLFWNVSLEDDKVLCPSGCSACSSLSLLHDESLCRFFWHFSISIVDIANGFHGIPNSRFPSKHSSDKINFFTATWTRVAERPFFLPDDVLGTTKKKKTLYVYISEKIRLKYVKILYFWRKRTLDAQSIGDIVPRFIHALLYSRVFVVPRIGAKCQKYV